MHVVFGTCESAGYSNRCCYPPGNHCRAADGNCYCGSDCHDYNDCCRDVNCSLSNNIIYLSHVVRHGFLIADPRTCADVGITTCCSDATNTGLCEVHFRNSPQHCSCNVSCHLRNDCCSDAQEIGCIRKT